jgi:uncharacterized Zn-finger protein
MATASLLREPGTVTRVSADTFQVIGRQGDVYHVTIRPGDARCTCPAGRFHRHCWHLDRLAEVARRSGAVREVFTAGLVWVRFRVLGHLLADGAVELVGKIACSYCSEGPLTVSAPAGDWSRVICPACGGELRCRPAGCE